MRTIPLIAFSDLEKTSFTGFYKFIILSINQFMNGKKFILLGPCSQNAYHRQIILSFLEEKELTTKNIRVTTFGGGVLELHNPAANNKGIDFNEVVDKMFDRERPIMIFAGFSYVFGTTSQEHIIESLQDGGLLENQFLPCISCDKGIVLARKQDVKIKTYSIEELKDLED